LLISDNRYITSSLKNSCYTLQISSSTNRIYSPDCRAIILIGFIAAVQTVYISSFIQRLFSDSKKFINNITDAYVWF